MDNSNMLVVERPTPVALAPEKSYEVCDENNLPGWMRMLTPLYDGLRNAPYTISYARSARSFNYLAFNVINDGAIERISGVMREFARKNRIPLTSSIYWSCLQNSIWMRHGLGLNSWKEWAQMEPWHSRPSKGTEVPLYVVKLASELKWGNTHYKLSFRPVREWRFEATGSTVVV